MVTTENQSSLRGFNRNYMTKGQATRIQNEWRKIQNQPWSLSTKERVLMKRVGKPARDVIPYVPQGIYGLKKH